MNHLSYEVAGQGPLLVLLHAFPLSRKMWARELREWTRFARVVAPDLPGFGDSPRQREPSIPAMAASVLALLDTLGIHEPVIAGGLSMGGYVVFEMARQAPERVRALGLFATRANADTDEQRRGRFALRDRILQEGVQPLIDAMVPKLLGSTTRAEHPDITQALIEEIRRADPAGIADALATMARRADATDRLPSLMCPTLIVAGEEDAVIPSAQADEMRRRIPGACLERIPRAGHLINLEQPERFRDVVERFVRSLP